jgi:hypothetical protein
MSITDIQDARAMKRMGAPLNTPVEHRKFDRAVSKHFMVLAKAENGFDKAFYEYIDGRGAGTLAKFNLMKRRSESLYKAAIGAQTFAENFSKDPAQKQIITLLVRNALVAVEY